MGLTRAGDLQVVRRWAYKYLSTDPQHSTVAVNPSLDIAPWYLVIRVVCLCPKQRHIFAIWLKADCNHMEPRPRDVWSGPSVAFYYRYAKVKPLIHAPPAETNGQYCQNRKPAV